MLRQVSLEIRAENRLQDAAKEFGTKLNVVDCKSFNKKGMTLLLELKGEQVAVRKTIAAFRKMEGIRQALEGDDGGDTVPLLLVLDRPSVCRASSDSAIICLDCPLNAEDQPASWRFIVRRTNDLRQILTRLSHDGVQTRIEDVSPLDQKATLTGRQKEIIATAVAKGYFEFPRKISLTNLSQLVGVKPSTLSEILRSAERRIMENAVGTPFPEE
ncbi:MAG TPA: helix-turn-helix domain-containing protein [Nitrososphaerales archaeon]|nr:helix-turn-helix domain-containing protein [Nitrososphaerales archaeon]